MRTILFAILFSIPLLLCAQTVRKDTTPDTPQKKRIHILNSDDTKLIESDSGTVSRFWHNVKMEHEGVFMDCDSAMLWPNGIFEAFGNTKVVSGTTTVRGDMMIYSEITGKANVKGRIVYLTDGSSTLRTTEVDFDTGTDTGYFEYGGTIVDSFRILESQKGYYYSKIKEFEFIGKVQSDTKDHVLQSDSMTYNTNTKIFTFYSNTHIWSDNGYLYCDRGWYDSDRDIMFFHRNSYMLSEKQEIFADSIYYENMGKKGKLYSNVQVVDTVQKSIAMADFSDFDMNTENFLMRRNPSIILYDNNDSVFIRADTLYSVTRTMKIPVINTDSTLVTPENPVEDTAFNAVSVRDSILQDTIKRISDTIGYFSDTVNYISDTAGYFSDTINYISDTIEYFSDTVNYISDTAGYISDTVNYASDTVKHISDTTAYALDMAEPALDTLKHILDTIAHASDTLEPLLDTTEYIDSIYKELFAFKNVKLYRHDFQLRGDSIYFNNIDSIWKTYQNPILWEGKKMQITSDSMKFHIKDGKLDHADFEGKAMAVIPEGNPDSTRYFNQIKAKNMTAYLKNSELYLFDATGNVQTLVFSLNDFTMNLTESSSFSILFESGKARYIKYFDQISGNNNPLFLVKEDEIQLQGYRWEIDLRPKSGDEVLNRSLRQSERTARESLIKPTFPITKRIDEIELKIKN
ncbi:MAG: hypothetical protein LBK97_04255 [Prevotellaceae bacterium]|jgi:lipopolysaccharide export system protein LptA|nr:hypothetical protein [Prevotellaceae bacterium]